MDDKAAFARLARRASRLRARDVPGGGRSNARAALVDDSRPAATSAAPAPNARRVTRGATEPDRRSGSAHLMMCDRRDAERDAERGGAARATPPTATQRENAIVTMGEACGPVAERVSVWCAPTNTTRKDRAAATWRFCEIQSLRFSLSSIRALSLGETSKRPPSAFSPRAPASAAQASHDPTVLVSLLLLARITPVHDERHTPGLLSRV